MFKKKLGVFLTKTSELFFVALFFLVYIKISRLGTSDWASLSELLAGTARRPFIYRILLPQFSQILARVVPANPPSQFFHIEVLQETFTALGGSIYPHVVLWILTLIFLSIIGFVCVEKHFLADLGFSQQAQNILPFFLLILALPFTVYFGYLYDLPQLFLFTFSLWLLYKKRWGWYLILFILTTLNKETSILLSVVFYIYYFKKLDKKIFYQLLLAQFSIYLFIRFSLIWVYRHNPGNIVYPTFFEHLNQYKTQPILFLLTLLLFFSVFLLTRKNWAKKNSFLKSATIVPLLILPLYFFGGMPMEFRVFLEVLPILGILIFDPEKLH